MEVRHHSLQMLGLYDAAEVTTDRSSPPESIGYVALAGTAVTSRASARSSTAPLD